jgi:hypothetical protein
LGQNKTLLNLPDYQKSAGQVFKKFNQFDKLLGLTDLKEIFNILVNSSFIDNYRILMELYDYIIDIIGYRFYLKQSSLSDFKFLHEMVRICFILEKRYG